MTDTSDTGRSHDLRDRLRQLAQPLVDSLDARLRDQVDARVEQRVTDLLAAKLTVLEHAIADLDRSVAQLRERLDRLDHP
ncbi:MAG: hypothetical protein ACP5PB_04415 [Acidimicrobiales bacterium]